MGGSFKDKELDVNGSAGAFVDVTLDFPCSHVTITEAPPSGGTFDGTNFNAMGMNYQLLSDNFAVIHGLEPGADLPLGEWGVTAGSGAGGVLGYPARPGLGDRADIPATVIAKLKSATVTATHVRIRQWR